jgi:hypothetical protein
MKRRNWKREVQDNLQEFKQREASVFHNAALSKLYIERGTRIAVVVILGYCASRITHLSHQLQTLFLASSLIGALIAIALVSIGLIGRSIQRREQAEAESVRTSDDTPAIGW